jgi:rhamnosyltransferase
MRINLYLPTLNAGAKWPEVIAAINAQTATFSRRVIIDSGSTDGTLSPDYTRGFEIISIHKSQFDHGGTRQMAVERYPDADIFVFLTQDAILASQHAVQRLVEAFENNPKLAVAYGRQRPHKGAKTLEAHARLFNYPEQSNTRSRSDAGRYGIKTISCSNSFAAYRKEAFMQCGGFPSGSILGEDVILAGKMLLQNWEIAYVAEAEVYHSHNYTLLEEYKRYFDIGVFHADNSWIFDHYGRAESEGLKYVQSEFSYVLRHNALALPKSMASVVAKWLGYKAGLRHMHLPNHINKAFSMHRHFWDRHTL